MSEREREDGVMLTKENIKFLRLGLLDIKTRAITEVYIDRSKRYFSYIFYAFTSFPRHSS